MASPWSFLRDFLLSFQNILEIETSQLAFYYLTGVAVFRVFCRHLGKRVDLRQDLVFAFDWCFIQLEIHRCTASHHSPALSLLYIFDLFPIFRLLSFFLVQTDRTRKDSSILLHPPKKSISFRQPQPLFLACSQGRHYFLGYFEVYNLCCHGAITLLLLSPANTRNLKNQGLL